MFDWFHLNFGGVLFFSGDDSFTVASVMHRVFAPNISLPKGLFTDAIDVPKPMASVPKPSKRRFEAVAPAESKAPAPSSSMASRPSVPEPEVPPVTRLRGPPPPPKPAATSAEKLGSKSKKLPVGARQVLTPAKVPVKARPVEVKAMPRKSAETSPVNFSETYLFLHTFLFFQICLFFGGNSL